MKIGATSIETVPTADGWWAALACYEPARRTRRHPVLLCPGLASNRCAFDLGPDHSFARHLASRGFAVYTLELRGHGYAARPPAWAPWRFRWSLDTYLEQDVPAAIEAVRARSEADALHWVGHSMGGILLYCALSRDPGLAIRSGITVGSALDYSVDRSDFHTLRRLRWMLAGMPRVPLGMLSAWTAPLAGRWATPSDRFNACPDNVEPRVFRRLSAHAFHDVPAALLRQLSTGFEAGGICDASGRRYIDGLPRVRVPILAVSGTEDRQCPPKTAAHTVQRLGGASQTEPFGLAHGHRADYGHFDLLMGTRAATEVWPHLDKWLDEHD